SLSSWYTPCADFRDPSMTRCPTATFTEMSGVPALSVTLKCVAPPTPATLPVVPPSSAFNMRRTSCACWSVVLFSKNSPLRRVMRQPSFTWRYTGAMTGTWEYVDGEPWYVRPGGRTRARGRWITCKHCGKRCPAQMRNPGNYCSRTCSALAREPWGDRAATRADLFSAWTPDECWLTGLIWADGCLTMSRGKPFVVLSMTDEQAVRDAAHVAGCRYHRRAQTPPRRDVFTMK